ncbi:FitA-like ribbon-helix-helix domain-containing protein [Geodermatophilus amargosae]|nr:hypothetical protein [Geodermatophilus amargosae]
MTILDVPDETRDELAARAARAGQSLQEYVRAQLIELARRPSRIDFWDRVEHRVRSTESSLAAQEILDLRKEDRGDRGRRYLDRRLAGASGPRCWSPDSLTERRGPPCRRLSAMAGRPRQECVKR